MVYFVNNSNCCPNSNSISCIKSCTTKRIIISSSICIPKSNSSSISSYSINNNCTRNSSSPNTNTNIVSALTVTSKATTEDSTLATFQATEDYTLAVPNLATFQGTDSSPFSVPNFSTFAAQNWYKKCVASETNWSTFAVPNWGTFAAQNWYEIKQQKSLFYLLFKQQILLLLLLFQYRIDLLLLFSLHVLSIALANLYWCFFWIKLRFWARIKLIFSRSTCIRHALRIWWSLTLLSWTNELEFKILGCRLPASRARPLTALLIGPELSQ